MIDLKQEYRKWNCHEATSQSLQINARKEVLPDRMPLTKAPINGMINNP